MCTQTTCRHYWVKRNKLRKNTMCCLRTREMHLKVFVVCYLWSSSLRHTLYLTLALSRLAPALLISLTLFPESLVCSTPSTSGTGHMRDLLDWPGPHPASSHTCLTALLHFKLNCGRHTFTHASRPCITTCCMFSFFPFSLTH